MRVHRPRHLPFSTLAVATALLTTYGCAPSPDDPPTKIADPKAELPAPKAEAKAQSDAAEKRRKKQEERRAQHENDKREYEAARTGASAELGKPAPQFTLKRLDGEEVALTDFRGKTVVLEWFNPECPFVKYAHGEGPLVDQAKRVTQTGVVWLSINSGAPGQQGHGLDKNVAGREGFGMTNPVLLDEAGAVGRLYGAKTTPHMFVIDPEGTLVYRGAIDNAPMGKPKGGAEPINYVDAALADLAAERPVATAEAKSYGCSVKYGS